MGKHAIESGDAVRGDLNKLRAHVTFLPMGPHDLGGELAGMVDLAHIQGSRHAIAHCQTEITGIDPEATQRPVHRIVVAVLNPNHEWRHGITPIAPKFKAIEIAPDNFAQHAQSPPSGQYIISFVHKGLCQGAKAGPRGRSRMPGRSRRNGKSAGSASMAPGAFTTRMSWAIG